MRPNPLDIGQNIEPDPGERIVRLTLPESAMRSILNSAAAIVPELEQLLATAAHECMERRVHDRLWALGALAELDRPDATEAP